MGQRNKLVITLTFSGVFSIIAQFAPCLQSPVGSGIKEDGDRKKTQKAPFQKELFAKDYFTIKYQVSVLLRETERGAPVRTSGSSTE